ncbi:MAG: rhodanese-like domain-containing protein [Vulcanimicrobiota bacterium]
MSIKEVDPKTAQQMLASDPQLQLLDVREPWEYEQAHIPGARLIPLGEVPSRYSELDAARPVLCVCAGGVRSMKAAEFLAGHGFTVTNLGGGTKGWMSDQLPVESA